MSADTFKGYIKITFYTGAPPPTPESPPTGTELISVYYHPDYFKDEVLRAAFERAAQQQEAITEAMRPPTADA